MRSTLAGFQLSRCRIRWWCAAQSEVRAAEQWQRLRWRVNARLPPGAHTRSVRVIEIASMSASTRRRSGIAASTLGVIQASVLLAGLATGATRPIAPVVPGQTASVRTAPSAHLGQPFDVAPGESLLTVLVYRAGPLAAFGHNHVVACRCVTGTVYVPGDPARASFDLRIPVNQFTVDDPVMRAAEHNRDFAPHISPSAQQAVRHNMLSTGELGAAQYPDIVLQAEGMRQSSDGMPGNILARVLVSVRGQARAITVPVHYDMRANEIVVTGQFPLAQTGLGLTPYRTMGGALRVKDAMTVRFRLVAKRRS